MSDQTKSRSYRGPALVAAALAGLNFGVFFRAVTIVTSDRGSSGLLIDLLMILVGGSFFGVGMYFATAAQNGKAMTRTPTSEKERLNQFYYRLLESPEPPANLTAEDAAAVRTKLVDSGRVKPGMRVYFAVVGLLQLGLAIFLIIGPQERSLPWLGVVCILTIVVTAIVLKGILNGNRTQTERAIAALDERFASAT